MRPMDFAKRTAANKLVDYLCADPENNMSKVMDKINAICPDALFPAQREAFTKVMSDPDNNMYQLMMRIMDLNPAVRNDMIKTVLVESNLIAWGVQEKMREKYRCNIPWAILLDPTSACNLHCTGCWAAEYGHKLNLSYDEIDSIIRQGKELGVHIYIYTGGEPLVRKHDLIKLCEAHPDCAFLCFTNATLIDEEFCQEMIRVKNFIPAISAEGDEAATDGRRGEGTYAKVEAAMDLLNSHGLPFGVSICYTHDNAPSVASDEYFDWLIEKGALFAWIFTYMPVGKDAPTSLMPTPEDRERLYRFNRRIRETKPILTLDFQHDASSWADASPVAGAICTSMLPVTSSPACSYTIRMPTSARCRCSTACARPSSWPTTKDSPSTTICCGRVRCSRIPSASSTWSRRREPTAPICRRPKALTTLRRNADPRHASGRRWQKGSGPTRTIRVQSCATALAVAWPIATWNA